jgi:response regulator RpfG family c-di-GMP phosphodiesterase
MKANFMENNFEMEGVSENPKVRILVVDDEELIQRAVARIFKKSNPGDPVFEVECASSVDAAIGKIESGFKPDAIISDLSMPGKTGKDFFEWVESNIPDLSNRFFIHSGGARGVEDLGRFYDQMAHWDRLFRKGDDIEMIRQRVETVIGPRVEKE